MMARKNYLTILSLLLLSSVTLTGCSYLKPEPEIITVPQIVEREITTAVRPKPVDLIDVKFYVVTEENFVEFKKTFLKENSGFVLYAISVQDYEALSLNMAELERYIRQQQNVIIYYEAAVAPRPTTSLELPVEPDEDQ